MPSSTYVASVFEICAELGCRTFASIVETDACPTATGGLRKDYAYLFERFFYFLEDNNTMEQGIVVFDELEKSQSHLLIDQMHRYFADTVVGQQRSSRIIPEPFFVHSDLTTGVQIADLVAYVISCGFRMARMNKPARPELSQLSNQGVFRNSCGRTSHEDRRVEIAGAENAEPGVAADGVPQQDAAEESMATSAAAKRPANSDAGAVARD